MSNKSISVKTDKERVILGSDYLTLKDQSYITFETSNLISFLKYNERLVEKDTYVDGDTVTCYNPNQKSDIRDYKPVSICTMLKDPMLEYFETINNSSYPIDQFIQVIDKLQSHLSTSGLHLKSNIENLSFKKIVQIDRQQDNSGNYNLAVKAEKAPNQEYDFPKELTFNFDIYQGIATPISITAKLFVKWSLDDGNYKILFRLYCANLRQLIKEEKETYFFKLLQSDSNNEVFIGKLHIYQYTDSWKYRKNSAVIED